METPEICSNVFPAPFSGREDSRPHPLSSFQLNWAALASHSSSVSFKRRDSVTQQCRRLVRCMCWQSTRSFSVEQHVCREGKYLVMMKTKKNLHHHWNYRSSPWYTIHAPNAISFRRPCASNHSAHITRLTPAQGILPCHPSPLHSLISLFASLFKRRPKHARKTLLCKHKSETLCPTEKCIS